MPGTNCANVPSSLALRSGATLLQPVALPPGCARLAASPDPTGSETPRKTIGIVEVARRAARAVGVAQATMTSTLPCKTSPGGDQQPEHLRPRRRLHTSEPRPGSAAARYHAAWKAHKGSLRQ